MSRERDDQRGDPAGTGADGAEVDGATGVLVAIPGAELPDGAGETEALAAADGEPSPQAETYIDAARSARINSFAITRSSFRWPVVQCVLVGDAAVLGVVAGDAAVDGAVVTTVAPAAAAVVAAVDGAEVVAVVGDDDAAEVVPATMGTDVVDGVVAAGTAAPEGAGVGPGVCAWSDALATTRATTIVRLRKESMESS